MNSNLNSALVVVACLLCTSITGATPLPRTDDLLARRAAPISLRDLDIHLYPSLIPRDSLVHNLFARTPDDIEPTKPGCPVPPNNYPPRKPDLIDTRLGEEVATEALTGKFRTQQPKNTAVVAKLQRYASLADAQHVAQCELVGIEKKLRKGEIDKGHAEITMDDVIALRTQVSIDDHPKIDRTIIDCILLEPTLESKLANKLTRKLGLEGSRALMSKLTPQIQAVLAKFGPTAVELGPGRGVPTLPPAKRRRTGTDSTRRES